MNNIQNRIKIKDHNIFTLSFTRFSKKQFLKSFSFDWKKKLTLVFYKNYILNFDVSNSISEYARLSSNYLR
jgi:hypothetical protein